MWTILKTKKFTSWLNKLNKEQFIKVDEWVMVLKELGRHANRKISKALGNGLFEIKEKVFGLRIYYTFLPEQRIILLCGGDKSSQSRDIKNAYKLLSML